jgi:hypothetical protein
MRGQKVIKMKPKNTPGKQILYPAEIEIEEGLVLYYAVEIQENGEHNTYIELCSDDSDCDETEEVCIRMPDSETARKLAYALSVFADSMDEYVEDEEYSDDEEEEYEEDWPVIEWNKDVLSELEDMGISFEIGEDDVGDE